MLDERAEYARCVLQTKNLFRQNTQPVPTRRDIDRDKERVKLKLAQAAQKVHHGLEESAVTGPLVTAAAAAGGETSTAISKGVLDSSCSVPTYHPKWEIKRVLVGHTGWVRALDVDVDNEWFVSGGNDRLIKIWDLASGELKLTLTGHIHGVRGLKVSPRHPYLFSCGEDHVIKCWDLEANQVVRQYQGHMSAVYCLDIHPELDVLVSGGRDSTVRIWDMRTRDELICWRGHTSSVFSVLAQSHEPQIISGSADRSVRTWDLKAGKVSSILTHHSKSIRALAAHPRQWKFLSASADAVKVWTGSPATYTRDLEPCRSIVNSISVKDDPTSAVVVLGCDNGLLHFYDFESGRKFQTIESTPVPGSLYSESGINVSCFDKSETRLITGESDKTVRIWQEVT